MSATNEILVEAASLQGGETRRILCPACRGGRTNELSLNVTAREDGSTVWHCFRASCGFSGSRHNGGRYVPAGGERLKKKARKSGPFRGELRSLTPEEEHDLYELVGFRQEHLRASGVMFAPVMRRYAFPTFGPMGTRRGWLLRTWDTRRGTKALTFPDGDEPVTSYYVLSGERPVILVEDIPSAVRASSYVNAAALLGTGLSKEAAVELSSVTRNVVIALDNDATSNAIKMRNRINLLFDSVAVLPLDQDMKDTPEDELEALLRPFM